VRETRTVSGEHQVPPRPWRQRRDSVIDQGELGLDCVKQLGDMLMSAMDSSH
jgi:hypothetical protein